MPEISGVLTEAFAMIGFDDHPCSLKDETTIKFIDETAELLIEVRRTIVIQVATWSHPSKVGR
jgi:hypothetical protein